MAAADSTCALSDSQIPVNDEPQLPTGNKFRDLTGSIFGNLTVLKFVGIRNGGEAGWLCQCGCGLTCITLTNKLRGGRKTRCNRSDGCVCSDENASVRVMHERSVRIFRSPRNGKAKNDRDLWRTMRRRCNDRTQPNYKYYGGRGIKVCERWDSFENFIADMGHGQRRSIKSTASITTEIMNRATVGG